MSTTPRTNWKKELLREIADTDPNANKDTRVLLRYGTRRSVGNGPQHSMGDAEINRRIRIKDNKAALEEARKAIKKLSASKTIEERLRGLFGGG